MLNLSPDHRGQQRNSQTMASLGSLVPRSAGASSSSDSSTSQSSSPPLLSPTGSVATTGSSVGSITGHTATRASGTIRTSPPPLLSLPLTATTSQPLAIPVTTTAGAGLAGPAYPGSQLSPIQTMPPPSVHFPHAAPLLGATSPPGAASATFYDHTAAAHLHHPHHLHHLSHHDKLVTATTSILTPSLIPSQYVELFIV
ncbi:homeobox protein OTX1-like [Anopheles cruzii]|uniref:homeobox protein OTX1-like n=1 Tax=Anopheles cruzii TaxID=68878 RepID=UPI0022EC3984|nr:homeobox protein OTX1-like [Anopheles cruzii]